MRDLYASHAAALRDALRHAVERGGTSSLGVLHQGVPSPSTVALSTADIVYWNVLPAMTYPSRACMFRKMRCACACHSANSVQVSAPASRGPQW